MMRASAWAPVTPVKDVSSASNTPPVNDFVVRAGLVATIPAPVMSDRYWSAALYASSAVSISNTLTVPVDGFELLAPVKRASLNFGYQVLAMAGYSFGIPTRPPRQRTSGTIMGVTRDYADGFDGIGDALRRLFEDVA